jgi:glutamine synthetase
MAGLDGVLGVTIAFCDNNGITRSRTVPLSRLEEAGERGVGMTTLFPVFLVNDGITFAHEPLSTPSGDVRLLATPDRVTRLAGQPAFAWTPGRQFSLDGTRSPYCQRGILERMVERATTAGLELRAGFELEWTLSFPGPDLVPAHQGPVYGPLAMLQVDEFCARLLADLEANGIDVGQFHAEYGVAQMELAIAPSDPVTAADLQLLARQTIHAAARATGLRASFAPLVSLESVGNGWHLHTSVLRDGTNLLSGGDGPAGMTPEGEAWVAGLLRELQALAAVGGPSLPSQIRRRPGYFAGAYAFWGVLNREAALRFVPASEYVPAHGANVELKASDASGNPYLLLAAAIGAGLAGIADGLKLPEGIEADPGSWSDEDREGRGVGRLPDSIEASVAAVEASTPVREALGDATVGAWIAVRRGDEGFAEGKTPEEIVDFHRYRY